MFPLGNLDTVGENLYSQWIVGDLLSISIQFCWGRILCRSHFLCSVPCGERKFINTDSGKPGTNPRTRQPRSKGRKSPGNREAPTSPSHTSRSSTTSLVPFITWRPTAPQFNFRIKLPRGAKPNPCFAQSAFTAGQNQVTCSQHWSRQYLLWLVVVGQPFVS